MPLPIIIREGNAYELYPCKVRIPLGRFAKTQYDHKAIVLHNNDILVFTSDGIDEATNPEGEEYGSERLLEVLSSIESSWSATQIKDYLIDDINNFVKDAIQHDDMTIVIIKIHLED